MSNTLFEIFPEIIKALIVFQSKSCENQMLYAN